MNLSTFDVIEYLDEKSIPYLTEGRNVSRGWIGVQCPWCGDESNHLGINLNSKTINCWRCGTTGMIFQYIQEIEQCTKSKVQSLINQFQDYTLDYVEREEETERQCKKPKGISRNFAGEFQNWIHSRRFDPSLLIKKYKLLVGKEIGFFKYRLVIPVYLNHRVVTYVGKDITNRQREPYKNWPKQKSRLDVKETLYNIDTVKDTALIVEGVTDVWRIGDGTVATFGTKYTKEQIRMLGRKCKKAYIMFDADATAYAFKFASDLSSVVEKIEVLELEQGDPADLSDKEAAEVRYEIFGRR